MPGISYRKKSKINSLIIINHLQIHFDLASFYFSREQYKEARENIWKASKIFAKLPKAKKYCVIQEDTLKGYCTALGITSEEEHDLFVQFLTCKSNHFNVCKTKPILKVKFLTCCYLGNCQYFTQR